jgi:hypothetical protein
VKNPLDLAEEVIEQNHRSAPGIAYDLARSVRVPVIELPPSSSPVGVVDTIDAATLGVMKRKAVLDPVWTTFSV